MSGHSPTSSDAVKMSGAVSLLLLCAFMAWTGATLSFNF
jgi:hypothetical protein